MAEYKATLLLLPGATKSVHYMLQQKYRGNKKKENRIYIMPHTTMQYRKPAKVIQPFLEQTKKSVVTRT